jgi:hypothetical protein
VCSGNFTDTQGGCYPACSFLDVVVFHP